MVRTRLHLKTSIFISLFFLLFMFLFLFGARRGVNAYAEKCKVEPPNEWIELTDLKGNETYQVVMQVSGTVKDKNGKDFSLSDNFKVGTSVKVNDDGGYLDDKGDLIRISFKSLLACVPSEFNNISFRLYYKSNTGSWDDTNNDGEGCFQGFFTASQFPDAGKFSFLPEVKTPNENCCVELSGGMPKGCTYYGPVPGDEKDLYYAFKGKGSSGESRWIDWKGSSLNVLNFDGFGDTGGTSTSMKMYVDLIGDSTSDKISIGTLDYSCDGNADIPCGGGGQPPGGSNTTTPPVMTCGQICQGEATLVEFDPNDSSKILVLVAGSNWTSCLSCVCDGNPGIFYESTQLTGHVWTELGCITPTQEGIVVAIMRVFFGVVTGIAVLRFVQAAILYNNDDPEKIKEAKSIAVSAVIAIIFAASLPILLNFIGLDILGIGNFVNIF